MLPLKPTRCAGLVALALLPAVALAHGVAEGDDGYIQEVSGFQPIALRLSRRQAHGHGLRPPAVPARRDLLPVPAAATSRCTSRCSRVGHSHHAAGGRARRHRRQFLPDRCHHRPVGGLQGAGQSRRLQRWFGVQPDTKAATLRLRASSTASASPPRSTTSRSRRMVSSPNLIAFNVGRRDRAVAGARRHPGRDGLLAPHRRLRPPCLCGECLDDGRGLPAHLLAALRLLRRLTTGSRHVQRPAARHRGSAERRAAPPIHPDLGRRRADAAGHRAAAGGIRDRPDAASAACWGSRRWARSSASWRRRMPPTPRARPASAPSSSA